MQILLTIVLLIIFLSFLIYKISGNFNFREIIIVIAIVIATIFGTKFYMEQKSEYLPMLFEYKYENLKKHEINKLSYKLVNNQNITSDDKFIYDFTYIITKGDKKYLCTSKNVIIEKIQDEFVFTNLNKIKEECSLQE